MNAPIYRLEGVLKKYEQRQVLQIDRLEIAPGEIFAVVGPSGAGKSTLLRLLNFLEPPSQGHIHFQECTITPETDAPLHVRRRVTTVFQRPLLLNRSVAANIRYGLQLRGARNAAAQTRAALDQVRLGGMADQRALTLSGGEAQRVALARALVLQPDVILLDEPTANLDPYNVGLIEEIIKAINQRESTTIVLVTHNVFQARRLANRIALLLEGQLAEVADTEPFFESPQDPRTAAFVRGEMVY